VNLRDSNNALLVKYDEEGFETHPSLLRRHPNKSTLLVDDVHGSELLRIAYTNRRMFRVNGFVPIQGEWKPLPAGAAVNGGCYEHFPMGVRID